MKNKKMQKKIGISISGEVLEKAHEEALRTCRTLSGFFEYAARREMGLLEDKDQAGMQDSPSLHSKSQTQTVTKA